jgi:hypothetical protein
MLETIYNVLATTTLAWSIVVVARPAARGRRQRRREAQPLPQLDEARRLAHEARRLHRQGQAPDCVTAIGHALVTLRHAGEK